MLKKIINFIKDNALFLISLFLMIFIPLIPKIPIVNVNNTWVYVRSEDFVVLFVLLFWVSLLYKKKVSIHTPLTLPILIFWLIGAISTFNAILFVFPMLANVFPNVAFFAYLRHIEYLSLFFVAYHSQKDKRFVIPVVWTLILTLVLVCLYGLGQKYFGFPAFLTGNEEFAKGTPIYLSALSRVPSTFAGHYDFAAYLVLMIPIVASLFFGFKNWIVKLMMVAVGALGLVLLFMTVSRVSFLVLLVSLFVVVFFQKKKLILLSIPILIAGLILLLNFQSTLLTRFESTVKETDVLINAQTGDALGNVQIVHPDFFQDKIVLSQNIRSTFDLQQALDTKNQSSSSSVIIFPKDKIPQNAVLLVPSNLSTGENLPQGTGYINLTLSPVIKKTPLFFYEYPPEVKARTGADYLALNGSYIVKRASAYDLSFTTRFQGEWPRAVEAFERNILLGSGYSSVTLAVDNNYLRTLGEVGLLGFGSLLVIFLTLFIYINKIWPHIEDNLTKSFIIGFSAGLIGLALNATLIDVFEASKIAFLLWLLVGIVFGLLKLYQKNQINLLAEFKRIAMSAPAVFVYLLSLSWVFFSPTLTNFFVGDDFTWLRWAADKSYSLVGYFTQADGFFYRPGTKIYFYLMYHFFWLNPVVYHLVSISLHVLISFVFFLLLRRVFKNTIVAFLSALAFLSLAGIMESVLWIAVVGHLFSVLFGLLGLLFFIYYEEGKKFYWYLLSFLFFGFSLLFHEMGVVFPLLIIAYKLVDSSIKDSLLTLKRKEFLFLYFPTVIYLIARFLANSHWQGGDYSYNLFKLPFNFVGNILGYLMLSLIGPIFMPIYEHLRNIFKDNLIFGAIALVIGLGVIYFLYKIFAKNLDKKEKGILLFALAFFVIALLPFLGLGNITERYGYLASMGVVVVLAVLANKFYEYIKSYGREISLILISLLLLTFFMYQIIWLKQTSGDWSGASSRVQNFFSSVDNLYLDSWSREEVNLGFVNVPIKYNLAWVFPVGLKDAVWVSFKNPNINVSQYNTLEQAEAKINVSCNNRILVFQDDGSVKDDQPGKLVRCQ